MQEIYAIEKMQNAKNKIEVLLSEIRHIYYFLFILLEKLNEKE